MMHGSGPDTVNGGGGKQPVSLALRFASSQKFQQLFANGMALIEETASYLDGDGRIAAKGLDARVGALYGSESMRLTTRLMQLASWLLLQRAVAEGEMTREQVLEEKRSIKLNRLFSRPHGDAWAALPEAFLELIERAHALQRRIAQLDAQIYGDGSDGVMKPERVANPVATQHSLLQTAFDPRLTRRAVGD